MNHPDTVKLDQPIDGLASTTAAFLGRALRGPLNTPVLINNFSEFRHRFGGFWSGSMLAQAVEQFFTHGGRQLYVVRIANNACGATIRLPGEYGLLTLEAAEPSSAEYLRAAVDYDNIETNKDERFNLTLQRVAPDSGVVLDQEIHRRLTCEPDSDLYVGSVLAVSSLMQVCGPIPSGRPASTDTGYVEQDEAGTDGLALSDYDLIGSANRGTGMFGLNAIEELDLLYMSPSTTNFVPGPAAVLAAELYCRRRGTILILDPPETWTNASEALKGVQDSGYASPDVLSYFPRAAMRGEEEGPSVAIGGAIAGLLCKLDRDCGPWEDLDQQGFELSRELLPALDISNNEAHLLVKGGLNVIAGQTPGQTMVCGSVTLARGSQSGDQLTSLTTRRLCSYIRNGVDCVTRVAAFDSNAEAVSERVVADVREYMYALFDAGGLRTDKFFVECDVHLGQEPNDLDCGMTILLTFDPSGSDETIKLNIYHTASGCRATSSAFTPTQMGVG